jgi:carboxymethylenebutenolidase
MKRTLTFFFLVLAWLASANAQAPEDKLVTFPGPKGTLFGYLYKPAGNGPFPAILWNHGSEKLPGWQPELAEYFTSHGYAFFLPHRSGQGRSPGTYVMDRVQNATSIGNSQDVVQAQEQANLDVVAAAAWLAQQPFINKQRMAMLGCSFGGIQTLLSSEKGMGFKAFVSFAPAAKSWSNTALQERLKEAAAHPKAPVFILQAANDFSTEPTRVLGPSVEKHAGKAKLYPAFGGSAQDGHWAFATSKKGTEVWGPDVLQFIQNEFDRASSK